MAYEFEDGIIEDEIPSDVGKCSRESMMTESSQKNIEENPAQQGQCEAGASAQPELPSPRAIANLLKSVLNVLEIKVRHAISIRELGICPQIREIDIFLMVNPYQNYEELMEKNESTDALKKLNQLRNEIDLRVPQI